MPLDQQLLDRLDAQWARLRPQWHATLAPGLGEEEQRELIAPLGLTIPSELRTWWAWRQIDAAVTDSSEILSLPSAVRYCQMRRDVAAEVAADTKADPEELWPQRFLAVALSGSIAIATDCSVQGPASPLFADLAHGIPVNPSHLALPSFGHLIHGWVEMYEAGYYTWDDHRGWIAIGPAQSLLQANLV